jgi:hypothetical protein
LNSPQLAAGNFIQLTVDPIFKIPDEKGGKMIEDYSKLFNWDGLEGILFQYKKKILKEIESVKDLMSLLMKGTKGNWTKAELTEIKTHFVTLGKKVPILMVFMLPGGLVLLPVLIEVLDRKTKKAPVQEDRRKSPQKQRGSPPLKFSRRAKGPL